jgi:hypothetical protein
MRRNDDVMSADTRLDELSVSGLGGSGLGGEIRCSVDTREYFTGVSSSTSDGLTSHAGQVPLLAMSQRRVALRRVWRSASGKDL